MENNFASRLKLLLEENNLSPKELSIKIKLDVRQIKKYLTDKVDVRGDTLIKLVKYFNVSLDFLLGLSDDRSRKHKNNDKVFHKIKK